MLKNKITAIIVAVILVAAAVFGFTYAYKASLKPLTKTNVQAGTENKLPPEKHGDEIKHEPYEDFKTYFVKCTFEGMIDTNSFEVTDENGEVYQLRIEGDRERKFAEKVEIGESIVVQCHYNDDNQLVAEKIMFTDLSNN